MLKRALVFIVITCLALHSSAQGTLQCQGLFSDKSLLLYNLSQIDESNNHFLSLNQKNNFVFDYPIERKSFLRRLTNNLRYKLGLDFDHQLQMIRIIDSVILQNMADPLEVELAAAELSLALFGPRNHVSDYITKSSDARFRENVLRNVGESIIRRGLMNTWRGMEIKNPSAWKRFRINFLHFQNHGLTKFLLKLPLPQISDKVIPDDLMAKIVLDGLDSHIEEVRDVLKTQNAIDTYNTFRKVAVVALFATIIGGQIITIHEQVSLQMDLLAAQKQASIQSLNEMPNQINQMVEQEKMKILSRAFANGIAAFQQEWGELPTAAEEQELYGKIIIQSSRSAD